MGKSVLLSLFLFIRWRQIIDGTNENQIIFYRGEENRIKKKEEKCVWRICGQLLVGQLN